MELLDPASGQVKKDFGLLRIRIPPVTGKTTVPAGLVLTEPELPAGPYSLRITALDSLGKEAVRSIPVQLEN